jgi:hypothetical protein
LTGWASALLPMPCPDIAVAQSRTLSYCSLLAASISLLVPLFEIVMTRSRNKLSLERMWLLFLHLKHLLSLICFQVSRDPAPASNPRVFSTQLLGDPNAFATSSMLVIRVSFSGCDICLVSLMSSDVFIDVSTIGSLVISVF